MSLYIEGIYCDDLQSVIQLTQQWSAVDGKSKDLVVAQSPRGWLCQLIFCRSRFQQMCWQVSASGQRRVNLPPSMSLCRSPAEGVAQIKGLCHHTWIWNLLCPRLTWNSEISLPQSPGIKGMYQFSWTLCLKISMPRSKSETCIFQPQDLDHKYAPQFWIVVHSTRSQADKQEQPLQESYGRVGGRIEGLEGDRNSQENQQGQLTWTPVGSQRLNHQPKMFEWAGPRPPHTYVANV